MSADKLVRMANQIATFMSSKPASEGVQGTAAHINDYWEPRMRRQLLTLPQEELHPLVVQALPLIRDPDAVVQAS